MRYKATKLAMGVMGTDPVIEPMVEDAINKEAVDGWTYHSMETFTWTPVKKIGCGPFKTNNVLPSRSYYVLIFAKEDGAVANPVRATTPVQAPTAPAKEIKKPDQAAFQVGDECMLVEDVESGEYICHPGETGKITIADPVSPELEFEGGLRLRCPAHALRKL